MRLVRKLANGVFRARRLWRSYWFKRLAGLRHPGIEWGRGVIVGQGVVVAVSGPSRVAFADGVGIERMATIVAQNASISVGRGSFIGIGTVITARDGITIGDNALIAEYVTIRDQDHDYAGERPMAEGAFTVAPVTIGNNVWIGAKATITKGVTIGDNAVIGANSVVTRDIPANAVAAGCPARVVKTVARGA